jgi:hypothetical protein
MLTAGSPGLIPSHRDYIDKYNGEVPVLQQLTGHTGALPTSE